jgi:preprotein translocase subunit SecG
MSSVVIDYVVPLIHVLACLFLIVVVLLQTGKGADMGAVFGGGSQTLFGSGGAGNFLTKLTTATAIAFMMTSLILTMRTSRSPTSELIERLPSPSAESEPATPPVADAGAPAAEPGAAQEATPPVEGQAAPAAEPAAPAADEPAPTQ